MLCCAAHRCTEGWYFKSKRCQRCDADVLSPGALAAVGIAAGAVVVLVAFKLFLRPVETLLQSITVWQISSQEGAQVSARTPVARHCTPEPHLPLIAVQINQILRQAARAAHPGHAARVAAAAARQQAPARVPQAPGERRAAQARKVPKYE